MADDGMNFDFVEAPAAKGSAPPRAAAGGSDLLDFVDEDSALEPKGEGKRKRPAPPMMAKGGTGGAREETLSLAEAGMDAPAGEDPKAAKKAEKERKKQERDERVAKDREERARRRAERGPGTLSTKVIPALASLRQPGRAAMALGVLVLVVTAAMGFRVRRTHGLFWSNYYLPSKKAASAAEAKVIERGLEKLAQGDFAGAREAVGAAAQLIAVLPDDDEVKAFFVLAASELKLEYGQVGGDWDQAKRVIEKMKGTKPSQSRARGAFALANNEVAKGLQLLAGSDSPTADLESVWLYGKALLLSGESARAAQVLDNALKTRAGSPKLLVLRGTVARDKGQLTEAAQAFQRALVASPDNGRALVELASVRLKQGEEKAAGDLLAKALDTDTHKTLDASEEARGNMLRGKLLASAHDHKGAEAAYERAVALDPNSATIREGYGDFRLFRREWEKAARQFEASMSGSNPSAAAYAGAARAYLGQNRLLEADKNINQAVAKDPNDAHYIYLQGRVAEVIGKGDEAFKKYEAALAKKPDAVEALAAEGIVYLGRMDKAKARERLDAILHVPDAQLSALENEATGDLALQLGDKVKAKEAYAQALKKDPEDPLAHAGMGKALAAEGDLPGARKELELALSQVDNDASIYFEYGSMLRRLGESDAALEALRKSVKLDSKDPRYRARFGALLVERGQFEDAEQQLRQAVLMNDRYAEGLFFLARALAGRKNLSEAVDTMKKAVEIEADNSDYLYHLGLIYEQGQQVQDAVDAFARAIDKNPKNADAYEHLGLNLMVENRFNEAVAAFKRAADLDPKRSRLWAEVGDAEQQSGDVDGAIRDFQKALAQDPHLRGVWTKLGIAYKDKDCKGCRSRALDALKRATHVDPADAVAHHELGYMYKDDGQRREAIVEFRRYLELRPDAGDLSTVQDDIYYLQEESRRTP
jgi:tetratricopeptide (TPR) repeat protein